VDEWLVPFKGHCPFRQYMPIKPRKYGTKIWAACDVSNSYAQNMQINTGCLESEQGINKSINQPHQLQGFWVCLHGTGLLKNDIKLLII